MAYSTTNPPQLVSGAPLTGAGQVWRYESTHTHTAVDAAGFITNALDLGMRVKDIVLVWDTTTNAVHNHVVLTVSSTGADLSDGTAIGSTANSD
jgi:hypothetical protein